MKNKEIIFVASWDIDIPPKWYGAVEDIIWNYKIFLEKNWFNVKIVNTKNILKLIKETVFVKHKIIHFHYEPYLIISYLLNRLFFRNNKIVFTCHNGYLVNNKETFSFKIIAKIISFFKKANMISISPLMEKYFVSKGFKWKKYIIQNWIDTYKFKQYKNPTKDIIYLWNINKNKWQERLLNHYNLENTIDFVWPYIDKTIDLKNHNYLWIWGKREVFEKLWNYKILVLLTKSEWDPLVIKEALSAGCSILTSKIGGVNLEENEFIKIIDIENKEELKKINTYIKKLLENNSKNRKKIIEYSKKFDWENIIKEYKKVLYSII